MSTAEDLLKAFASLPQAEKDKFLASLGGDGHSAHRAVSTPKIGEDVIPPSTPSSTRLIAASSVHKEGEALQHASSTSKKNKVTSMTYLSGNIRDQVLEKAAETKALKRRKGHIEINEEAVILPFHEVDQAGSHYRMLQLHLKAGAIAYTNPKRAADSRLYKIKDLHHLKQVTEEEWKLKFADGSKLKPVFETATSSYQFGYFIRLMLQLDAGIKKSDEEIKLFIGSWNVGNAPPVDVPFAKWIPVNVYDMYVIGAQECEYKPREGYHTCEEDWRMTVTKHMGDEYVLVSHTSMWQIRLLVFVRKSLRHNITNIGKSKEATGIGSVLGNKGGVAIGFDYLESSVCFVNSHLAAHQVMIQERNNDVEEIIKNLRIGEHQDDVTTAFQYAFWCGDLNYRIEGTKEGVQKLVREKSFDILFSNDQLQAEMKKCNVFFGFTEGKITFRPTYKFDRGVREEYSEELGRVPSWCDRILSVCWDQSPLKQTGYDAAFEVMTSDHSPVWASYELGMLRPQLPDVMKSTIIGIFDLHARNLPALDANGYSDPYIKFKGNFLKKGAKTSTINKTLNPNWENEIIVLQPFLADRAYLDRQFIEVIVWDRDTASKNDLLGKGTLGLKNISDTPLSFQMELRHKGLPRGTLYGKIVVLHDVPAELLAVKERKTKKK